MYTYKNTYIKIQQSTQNYTTADNNQEYGQKHLGKRYGTIPWLSTSWHQKNIKESRKNRIKNNKQCSNVFNKTCLNNMKKSEFKSHWVPYLQGLVPYTFSD